MSEATDLLPLSEELIEALDSEQGEAATTTFYTYGSIKEFSDIKLEVKGLGGIRLPVAERRAKQLIKLCGQAPYGKGSKTLVDTSVRNVWELGPRKFSIVSPAWRAKLNYILENVANELGLANQKISAKPYKLLVYETGGFFLEHKDTEKTPGMFATLVISLPSEHSGGSVLLRHQEEEKRLNFGGKKSATQLQYLSFFADCSHEVKPIRSGYRCCLVYNLCFPKQRVTTGESEHSLSQQALISILQRWHIEHIDDQDLNPDDWNYRIKRKTCEKLAFVFDHQYTEAQLALHYLKGKDFLRAQRLLQAAEFAAYEAHFVLLSYYESGTPNMNDRAYNYWGSRRYGYYDDDEVDVDAPMADVVDEAYEVKHWFTPDGKPKKMGQVDIAEREVIANVAFKTYKADQTQYEGYMGNYGPSLDRWYHRAALLLWPKHASGNIALQAGFVAAVEELELRINELLAAKGKRKTQQYQACCAYAFEILKRDEFYKGSTVDAQALAALMILLPKLNNESLNKTFFSHVFNICYSGSEALNLVNFLNAVGWREHHSSFISLFGKKNPQPCFKPIELLTGCLKQVKQTRGAQQSGALKVIKAAAKKLLQHFSTWRDADEADNFIFSFVAYGEVEDSRVIAQKIEVLRDFLEYAHELFSPAERKLFVEKLVKANNAYPLHDVLIPVLMVFRQPPNKNKTLAPTVKHFVVTLLALLKKQTAKPVQVPKHWKMGASWACNCNDCQRLKPFLKDAKAQRLEVKLAKARRAHMHRIVEAHVPDLAHETRRSGSPYTLVFEKNRNSYVEKQRLWEKELKIVEGWPR